MLVRESVDFIRGKDSKKALNLGIEAHIDQWMKDTGLNSRYELREYSDGKWSILYYGVLDLNLDKVEIPDYFGFEYAHQMQIRSTNLKELPEGLPEEIGGKSYGNVLANDFKKLESFQNFPKKIRKNLYAIGNRNLTSLKGFPLVIGGDVFLNGSGFDQPDENMSLSAERNYWTERIYKKCQLGGEVKW